MNLNCPGCESLCSDGVDYRVRLVIPLPIWKQNVN